MCDSQGHGNLSSSCVAEHPFLETAMILFVPLFCTCDPEVLDLNSMALTSGDSCSHSIYTLLGYWEPEFKSLHRYCFLKKIELRSEEGAQLVECLPAI